MITPDKLPPEVIELLPAGVSEWARLAIFILAEQHRGEVYLFCHIPRFGLIRDLIGLKSQSYWFEGCLIGISNAAYSVTLPVT